MQVSFRNAITGGKKISAKSYIQDGLIAMWDGVENAGWGVHDPNATTWKDLIGNLDATTVNSPTFGEDSTDTSGGYWRIPSNAREIVEVQSMSCEAVFQPTYSSNNPDNQGVIGFGENRSVWLYFGIQPLASNASLNWQFRNSAAIRVWQNNGIFGRGKHSSTLVNDNNVCNCFLDATERTITKDVTGGTATSEEIYSIGYIYRYRNFYGKIHCIRVYSRALTESEIAHNYAIDRKRFGVP